MKNITSHNCEAWMLDYFEGRLSAKQSAELIAFLDEHPEWKTEFEAFGEHDEGAEITPEHSQAEPSDLQSTLLQNSRDEDLIALLEGQLHAKDASHLLKELEHDEKLAGEFALYQLTKLKPDFNIQYPHKLRLKKSTPVRVLMVRYAAVAALLFGAFVSGWLYFNPLTTPSDHNLANASTENLPATTEHSVNPTEQGSHSTSENNKPNSSEVESKQVLAESKTENTRTTAPKYQQNTRTPNPRNASPASETLVAGRQEMQIAAMHTRQSTNISVLTAVIPAQLTKKETTPPSPEPNWLADEPTTGLGGMLANFGQNVVERLKNATGNNVVIEQEESPEDDLYTSTFRLGSLEIYRSRIKKE